MVYDFLVNTIADIAMSQYFELGRWNIEGSPDRAVCSLRGHRGQQSNIENMENERLYMYLLFHSRYGNVGCLLISCKLEGFQGL